MHRSPLAIALLALGLAACSPQDPQQRVSAALTDSVLLQASQQELAQQLAERPYHCPIPQDVTPSPLK